MAATLRSTPRNEPMYRTGSILARVRQALNQAPLMSKEEQRIFSPRSTNTAPIGSLLMGEAPEALQDWSYEGSRGPISGRNIQTLRIDPRLIDVAGVAAPGVAAAPRAARALAPTAARQAVGLMEKYGVSPVMAIVKPEGNLNLTPRIRAEMLKGPEKQSVESYINQLKSTSGVTKEGIAQITAKYNDPKAVLTKQEFENSLPASQYNKVDLAGTTDNAMMHFMTEAQERVAPEDVWIYSGLPEELAPQMMEISQGYANFSDLDDISKELLREHFNLKPQMTDEEVSQKLYSYAEDAYENMIADYADQLAYEADVVGDASSAYAYKSNQRLIASQPDENSGYFEFGVTHPEQQEPYRHYSSNEAPKNLIGHVRGTLTKEPTVLEGGIEVPSNTYVAEEFQSDVQKGAKQTGHLHQVHGTLFKAAIQDALEKGADSVYIPTAYPIAKVRGYNTPDKYATIYDQALKKEGLEPLSKLPGIEINPVVTRHLNLDQSITDTPYYHKITFTPEAKETILKGLGMSTPGYAAGGLVYDPDRIDTIADDIANYAKGGAVEKEESIVHRIPKYVRKGQYKLAEMVGMKPEVEFATEIPERYFPANEQHMGRGDAMRHLLLQAQLQQRFGDLGAYLIGQGHEIFSGGQTEEEAEQDRLNDILGRQIGREAKDKADIAYRALRAVETGQAKTLTDEQKRKNNYAQGGLVYDADSIDQLADTLLG